MDSRNGDFSARETVRRYSEGLERTLGRFSGDSEEALRKFPKDFQKTFKKISAPRGSQDAYKRSQETCRKLSGHSPETYKNLSADSQETLKGLRGALRRLSGYSQKTFMR